MSISVVVAVFGLIALAELPDKTMIATLVMGSRSRPVLVWAGACAAFLVHVSLAVGAGRLVELLPRRVQEMVTTALFLGGAVFLLAVPEKRVEAEAGARSAAGAASPWRVVGGAFGVLMVGELGDLTQLLTINLAARYRDPISVFIGAYAALVAVAALGAWGGRALLRWLPLSVIRRVGGTVLAGFAAFGIYGLVR